MSSKGDAYRKDLGNPDFGKAPCWKKTGGLKKGRRKKGSAWQEWLKKYGPDRNKK